MSTLQLFQDLISPELKLAALLSLPSLSKSQIREGASLFDIAQPEILKQQIDVNRIWACAYASIEAHFSKLMPDNYVTQLRRKHRKNVKLSLLQFAALSKIEQLFAKYGIPAKTFKGIPLAIKLFGDISKRYSADIDILISQSDLKSAHIQLKKIGFKNLEFERLSRPKKSLHFRGCKDVTYTNDQGLVLELHIRLCIDTSNFSQQMTHQIFAPKSTEDEHLLELIYYCWHGGHTLFHRIKWLLDIVLYLKKLNPSECQVEELLIKARNFDLDQNLIYSWVMAHVIYKLPLPSQIKRIYDSNANQSKLVKTTILTLNAPDRNLSFRHRLDIFFGEMALLSSYRKKFILLLQKLRPTNLDICFSPGISDKTIFLYYFLRPLRIIYTELFNKRVN